MSPEPPFESVACPYCGATVIAAFPPPRGWPRTAITPCDHCGHRVVVERTSTNRFRTRKHRGVFEGLLRL